MLRSILKSKIHQAKVTDTRIDYVGSITICRELAEAAGLVQFEKVLVSDITNGARFETYVLEGDRGVIEVNGAAAKLVKKGDRIIIMAFGLMDERELKKHKPSIVVVDGRNRITSRLP